MAGRAPNTLDLRRPATSRMNRRQLGLVIGIMVVVLGGILWWAERPQSEPGLTLGHIKRLASVPPEDPTIATVTDKTKVTNPFLSESHNGDKVVIFSKAGKVLLYRPSSNRIIAYGPLSVDPAYAEAQGASIAILTSTTTDAGSKLEATVAQLYPAAKLSGPTTTARPDYPRTLVITQNVDKQDLATALVKQLGATSGVLPMGEPSVTADIVILVGSDQR